MPTGRTPWEEHEKRTDGSATMDSFDQVLPPFVDFLDTMSCCPAKSLHPYFLPSPTARSEWSVSTTIPGILNATSPAAKMREGAVAVAVAFAVAVAVAVAVVFRIERKRRIPKNKWIV